MASDASHFYENFEQDKPYAIVTDLPDMYAAFDRLRELAGAGGVVVPGHDPRIRERHPRLPGSDGGSGPADAELVAVSGYDPGDRLDGWYDALLVTVSAGGPDTRSAAAALAAALSALLVPMMVEAGHDAMDEMRGALAKTVKALEPYVNPLTVSARLQPKTAAAGAAR